MKRKLFCALICLAGIFCFAKSSPLEARHHSRVQVGVRAEACRPCVVHHYVHRPARPIYVPVAPAPEPIYVAAPAPVVVQPAPVVYVREPSTNFFTGLFTGFVFSLMCR